MSIIGFDDIELARIAHSPLITIHVPHRYMGQRVAQILIDMVNGQTTDKSVQLASEIRLRDTSGPAPTATRKELRRWRCTGGTVPAKDVKLQIAMTPFTGSQTERPPTHEPENQDG